MAKLNYKTNGPPSGSISPPAARVINPPAMSKKGYDFFGALTLTQLTELVGRHAYWTIRTQAKKKNQLKIEVVIKEVELKYGKPFYTVIPVSGSGEVRITDRLEII